MADNYKEQIEELFKEENAWDGNAGNSFAYFCVLGSSRKQILGAILNLASNGDATTLEHISNENFSFYYEEDEAFNFIIWDGCLDYAHILSREIPDCLVVSEDNGWYGIDEAVVSKNGAPAVPGVDYTAEFQCELNEDYEDEDEVYYDVQLTIFDSGNRSTSVGGGMIAEDDMNRYKALAAYTEQEKELGE